MDEFGIRGTVIWASEACVSGTNLVRLHITDADTTEDLRQMEDVCVDV